MTPLGPAQVILWVVVLRGVLPGPIADGVIDIVGRAEVDLGDAADGIVGGEVFAGVVAAG